MLVGDRLDKLRVVEPDSLEVVSTSHCLSAEGKEDGWCFNVIDMRFKRHSKASTNDPNKGVCVIVIIDEAGGDERLYAGVREAVKCFGRPHACQLRDLSPDEDAHPCCSRWSLLQAAHRGHRLLMQYLCSAGIDLNEAVGHLDLVRLLCQAGADKDAAAVDGMTPLHTAAKEGFQDVVDFLCDAGARVDPEGPDGGTPLHAAAERGHLAAVRSLWKARADLNKTSVTGATPLSVAARQGHVAVVRLLCGAGVLKDQPRSDGATPLFAAAAAGHLEVVVALCEAGANKDKPLHIGLTPLTVAAHYKHIEVVRHLCTAGAGRHVATQFASKLLRTARGAPEAGGGAEARPWGREARDADRAGGRLGSNSERRLLGQRRRITQDRSSQAATLARAALQERRVAEDGRAYSRAEFIDFYGEVDGYRKWEAALTPGAHGQRKVALTDAAELAEPRAVQDQCLQRARNERAEVAEEEVVVSEEEEHLEEELGQGQEEQGQQEVAEPHAGSLRAGDEFQAVEARLEARHTERTDPSWAALEGSSPPEAPTAPAVGAPGVELRPCGSDADAEESRQEMDPEGHAPPVGRVQERSRLGAFSPSEALCCIFGSSPGVDMLEEALRAPELGGPPLWPVSEVERGGGSMGDEVHDAAAEAVPLHTGELPVETSHVEDAGVAQLTPEECVLPDMLVVLDQATPGVQARLDFGKADAEELADEPHADGGGELQEDNFPHALSPSRILQCMVAMVPTVATVEEMRATELRAAVEEEPKERQVIKEVWDEHCVRGCKCPTECNPGMGCMLPSTDEASDEEVLSYPDEVDAGVAASEAGYHERAPIRSIFLDGDMWDEYYDADWGCFKYYCQGTGRMEWDLPVSGSAEVLAHYAASSPRSSHEERPSSEVDVQDQDWEAMYSACWSSTTMPTAAQEQRPGPVGAAQTEPERLEERRFADDGKLYTLKEFVAEWGLVRGEHHWQYATRPGRPPQSLVVAPTPHFAHLQR